ncbi:thiazolylpeptide-type bacteriocin [Kitasatospora sp. NPDC047058]|uniref:thiazolylpeptide-type bacteriocin n=1 Tax=unclassified Kitasatospora TaxID=2633591 RepID=UPI0033F83DE5
MTEYHRAARTESPADPTELEIEELSVLELGDAIALPEMGASNWGGWFCCSSSSSATCCC